MTSLYYEKCIQHPKVSTKTLITLSQLRRGYLKHPSVDSCTNYYNNLLDLCEKLRYNRITVKEHPTFEHEGYKSNNWSFECICVAQTLIKHLMADAADKDDLKEKNKLVKRALDISNSNCRMATSILFEKNSNKLCKLLNPRFHLSQTCSLAADWFHNMYDYKPNYLAILKAYQLKEISTLLWSSDDESKKVLTKIEAKALMEIASKIDDDMCGEKVALLQVVANKDGFPEEIVAKYQSWKQQNEQVYFTTVYTDKKIETVNIKDAFDILATCFQARL